MTDDLVYKIIPLPVARYPANVDGTPEERAARVQAHMDRVHPQLDAIKREESRVYLETGDPVERYLCNNRRWKKRNRSASGL